MRLKTTIAILCMTVALAPLAAHAETKVKEKLPVTIDAEKSKTIAPDITELTGNVVIKTGASEIRTDQAKVKSSKKSVTVTTKDFVVTIKR